MRTIMLQSGANLLNTQASGTAKLFITGFKAGDKPATQAQMEQWDTVEPDLTTMQGNVVASLDATNMNYVNGGNNDKARISCVIPQSLPEITIGNIILYASFDSTGVNAQPFCLSADDDAVVKLQTTTDSPGYDFISDIILDIYSLGDRFDFSNLSELVPDFLRVSDETYLPLPFNDQHDHFIINNHSQFGGLHFVLNSHNIFFANPLMQKLSTLIPGEAYILDGGTVGDGL